MSQHISMDMEGAANRHEIGRYATLTTAKELAKILNVPESWVYDHVKTLPHFKLGHYVRFDTDEVLKYCRTDESKSNA